MKKLNVCRLLSGVLLLSELNPLTVLAEVPTPSNFPVNNKELVSGEVESEKLDKVDVSDEVINRFVNQTKRLAEVPSGEFMVSYQSFAEAGGMKASTGYSNTGLFKKDGERYDYTYVLKTSSETQGTHTHSVSNTTTSGLAVGNQVWTQLADLATEVSIEYAEQLNGKYYLESRETESPQNSLDVSTLLNLTEVASFVSVALKDGGEVYTSKDRVVARVDAMSFVSQLQRGGGIASVLLALVAVPTAHHVMYSVDGDSVSVQVLREDGSEVSHFYLAVNEKEVQINTPEEGQVVTNEQISQLVNQGE